jgi:hypothetical protein
MLGPSLRAKSAATEEKKTEEIGATLFAKDQEQINFVACCVDEYTSF